MSSPIDFVKSIFKPDVVDSISAPVGAWIPPASSQAASGMTFEKGRPVMDAALAHNHNESLFSGMLSWGPVTGLAMIGVAFLWTRFLKS